jgi:type III secretory pathway component EscS
MLESIFYSSSATISMQNCLISVGVAVVLGIIISIVHKLTTKTTSNFLLTLTIIPVLVEVVIMLVNGNLGTSLAIAGAFSLIRFRSMPGNSKEIITVFWAMATGLACGMGYVVFAVIMTIVVGILVILMSYVLDKVEDKSVRKLKIVIPENLDYNEIFNDIFSKYTNKVELQKVKTTNLGSTFELTYSVSSKAEINEKAFLDEIRVRNANMLVMLEREELSEVEL